MPGDGGRRLFGAEKRCDVIDQKERVLDRGIQTPRNR